MVYGYKPEIQELPNSLKLVEREVVPQGNKISPELLAIRSKASEQGLKRVCEQELKKYVKFQINDEVWALNPNKSKLAPKLIGLYTVISVNKEHNTCCVQDKQGVQRGLHMDSFCLVKARAHKAKSKFDIPNITLENLGHKKLMMSWLNPYESSLKGGYVVALTYLL